MICRPTKILVVLCFMFSSVSSFAEIINLFGNATPTNFGGEGLWYTSFIPKQDLNLTGLGLIFDPEAANVAPSLYLSIWQGSFTTSNDDRIALLAPTMQNNDFSDFGMAPYLFRFADDKYYGSAPEIKLQKDITYYYLAQINIGGTIPIYVLENKNLPFQSPNGLVTVTGGNGYPEGIGTHVPSLFLETALSDTPLPAALPLMLSGMGILGFATRRKKV